MSQHVEIDQVLARYESAIVDVRQRLGTTEEAAGRIVLGAILLSRLCQRSGSPDDAERWARDLAEVFRGADKPRRAPRR